MYKVCCDLRTIFTSRQQIFLRNVDRNDYRDNISQHISQFTHVFQDAFEQRMTEAGPIIELTHIIDINNQFRSEMNGMIELIDTYNFTEENFYDLRILLRAAHDILIYVSPEDLLHEQALRIIMTLSENSQFREIVIIEDQFLSYIQFMIIYMPWYHNIPNLLIYLINLFQDSHNDIYHSLLDVLFSPAFLWVYWRLDYAWEVIISIAESYDHIPCSRIILLLSFLAANIRNLPKGILARIAKALYYHSYPKIIMHLLSEPFISYILNCIDSDFQFCFMIPLVSEDIISGQDLIGIAYHQFSLAMSYQHEDLLLEVLDFFCKNFNFITSPYLICCQLFPFWMDFPPLLKLQTGIFACLTIQRKDQKILLIRTFGRNWLLQLVAQLWQFENNSKRFWMSFLKALSPDYDKVKLIADQLDSELPGPSADPNQITFEAFEIDSNAGLDREPFGEEEEEEEEEEEDYGYDDEIVEEEEVPFG